MADYLYGSSSPPQTTALPDCGSASQPPPALLPASLDWPLEEKQLPDLFAAKVRGGAPEHIRRRRRVGNRVLNVMRGIVLIINIYILTVCQVYLTYCITLLKQKKPWKYVA